MSNEPEKEKTNYELPEVQTRSSDINLPPTPETPSEKQNSQIVERGNPQGLTQQPQQQDVPPQSMSSVNDDTVSAGQSNARQGDNSSASTNMPQIADDVDLIEKEWVSKAKDIVYKTKNDPRAQNREMNKLKAEYLKMRYNRDIKVEDS